MGLFSNGVKVLIFLLCASLTLSRKEDVIQEVDGKKLDKLLDQEEYLAVFFYTKTCRNCDKILQELENIDDDAEKFGVAFAKTTDKKAAKRLGVASFPALVYFRNKQPAIFEGDLMEEDKVLAWLTDPDSMELPDKIEEVNAKILENLVEDTDFVAVLFYKDNCEQCDLVLHEMEEIDDEADGLGIAFVKIADVALATEYGLDDLPTLVYYRRKIPIVYNGDLMNEEEVLKWLIEFKDIGDDPDSIEDVSSKALDSLIAKSPYLAVLFYDADDKYNQRVLKELENIDDDTDKHEIPFVKISDLKEAAEYGIEKLPALVYFENRVANFYQGDLMKEEELLAWLIKQKNTDEIEHVTEKFLEQLIREHDHVAVLFYDPKGRQGKKVLNELENIDDEMDQHGILFVKIDDDDMAKDYGITTFPQLVYFENEAPIFYDGDLTNEEVVLQWMIEQKKSDEIEDISDVVMVQMIKKSEYLAVLFYDADEEETKQVLADLEKIDDDTDAHNIPFVKIDNDKVAAEFGIDDLPALVYFENQIPYIYHGDLTDEDEVLKWLIHQKEGDEIEEITDKILERMIRKSEHLAVLFYDRDDPKSMEVLAELENIDDETDSRDLPFVRIDDDEVARAFGIDDELPTLVYFERQIPFVYQGDLKNEVEVLTWLLDQMTSDEIEEVTDKMLDTLIAEHNHLVVLFYDSKNKKSDKVLKELENIDDEADKRGIIFVKTDDKEAAQNYKINKLPALVYFQDKKPDQYHGDLMKEEEVLVWLLEHKASDDDIEEITEPTLQQLIDNSENLAVLFYDKDAPTTEAILNELENIDDELDGYEIPFVKIDDDSVAKKYGIMDELPILVYFEDKLPSVYEGDLTKEEDVLKWLVHQKDEDTIEEVTEEILEQLIKENEYVLVFYAPNNCQECPAILKELECIDDDTDSHGIMFVTTDDLHLAKAKFGIKDFPSLVLFRSGRPIQYRGKFKDVDHILEWATSEDVLDNPDAIDEINLKMLDKMLDRSRYLAVLFYKAGHEKSERVLAELENIDDEAEAVDIDFVKISDEDVAKDYHVKEFPSLVFFRNKFPQIYEGNLMNEEKVLKWLINTKNKKEDIIEYVDRKMLEMFFEDQETIVVFFYNEECKNCKRILEELEKIDDDTDIYGIHFVKMDDTQFAQELGVTSFPSLVYYEDGIPSIYSEDLEEEEKVLSWLVHQKKEDTIENVNKNMLSKLIADHEFVGVFLYEEGQPESQEVLKLLETLDDDFGTFGIHLVKIADPNVAKKYSVRQLPGMVLFRRGKPIRYSGDMKNAQQLLDWMTHPENLLLEDAIEKVNKKMLQQMLTKFDYVAILFYSKVGCKICPKVLEQLEQIDDEAAELGITLVKMDDPKVAKKYGIRTFPALIFFKKGEKEPLVYSGNLKNAEELLEWLQVQRHPGSDVIEEVMGPELQKLIDTTKALAVVFYDVEQCEACEELQDDEDDDTECTDCKSMLDDLENIDDDCERRGVKFVKTSDTAFAAELGVKEFPSLVYFEEQVPNIFEGDLTAEEEVLGWLVHQKAEDTIETVNRDMLENLIVSSQYLAVLLTKPNCRACDAALEELEKIDDETDLYGIYIVKLQDPGFAKRYGIKTYPALLYYRNGNPLIFDGDLKNEVAVLEWLTDDDNRELVDEIESINPRMLSRLIEESPFLAVLFYTDDCPECEKVLQELENIDDEADMFGIDFVKINHPRAAEQWNIKSFPTLAYFRRQSPVMYDGDLLDEQAVLKWLTSPEVVEIQDEIEEVNRKMLDKLLADHEFLAVFFYENNCQRCEEALAELEKIDDEADALEILFVKIRDARHARKYGISQMPALVFFRKKFPSIYRGDLLNEEEVLEWLQKNRYKHPEINLFLYGMLGISVAFILYTVIYLFWMKGKEKKE